MQPPQPELVEFTTPDLLHLPGLLYSSNHPSRTAVINLHGNGSASVFYNPESDGKVAECFTQASIAYFLFNNRGAHFIKTLRQGADKEERVQYGMAFELIKECLLDINGAAQFLHQRGFTQLFLMGHSTGANKICVYNFYQPENPFIGFILAAGADDLGLYYQALGADRFTDLLAKATLQIKHGNGRQLVGELMPETYISYQSLYDTLNPDGDYNCFPFYQVTHQLNLSEQPLFRLYQSIKKPTLAIYGSADEFSFGDVAGIVNILKQHTLPDQSVEFVVVKEADHGFHGYETDLATACLEKLLLAR